MSYELLLPAGDLNRLKFAIMYGADAVYIGGQNYSLRANANNFSLDEIREGVEFAHERGKKVYVTEVFVSNVTFLDSKGSGDSVNNLEEPPVKPGPMTTEQIDSMPTANDPFANFGNEVEINDSDLPF